MESKFQSGTKIQNFLEKLRNKQSSGNHGNLSGNQASAPKTQHKFRPLNDKLLPNNRNNSVHLPTMSLFESVGVKNRLKAPSVIPLSRKRHIVQGGEVSISGPHNNINRIPSNQQHVITTQGGSNLNQVVQGRRLSSTTSSPSNHHHHHLVAKKQKLQQHIGAIKRKKSDNPTVVTTFGGNTINRTSSNQLATLLQQPVKHKVAHQRGQVVYNKSNQGLNNQKQQKRVGVIINSASNKSTIPRRPNTTAGNTRIITATQNRENKSYIVNNNNNRINNNSNRTITNNNRLNNSNLSSIYSDQVTVNSESGGTSYSLLDLVDSLQSPVQKNLNQGRPNPLKGRSYKPNEKY